MLASLALLLALATPCTTLPHASELGSVECISSDGTKETLFSSVYDFRLANCTINGSDIITCKNVKIDQTKVFVTLIVDLRNTTATVR